MRHAGLLALLLTAACVGGTVYDPGPDDPGFGELDLSWQIGTSGCSAAGIVTVEVDLGDEAASFDCLSGGGTLTVPEGSYDIVMTGLDADGVARYGGSYLQAAVYESETTVVPTVLLGALPATMTVTWYFQNGRLCGSNDVAELDIVVYDDDYILDVFTTECDDGIEQVGPVLSGSYTVQLIGRDGQGQAAFTGESDVDLERGDDTAVEIELVATSG